MMLIACVNMLQNAKQSLQLFPHPTVKHVHHHQNLRLCFALQKLAKRSEGHLFVYQWDLVSPVLLVATRHSETPTSKTLRVGLSLEPCTRIVISFASG